ncbi:MAG: polyprenyl synthetase family protein [Ignavibacteria bacterium]|nr:polyprenyl synthetase family protein [Ignavibacteria bacterium]
MKDYSDKYNSYKTEINNLIKSLVIKTEPRNLYDPIRYILSGGGKRLRPVLTLFSCEAFGSDYRNALYAATAIELLHNFTLVHDDIMDNADTRRGKITIHKKWDRDTAILAGDHLIALSLKALNMTSSNNMKRIYDYYINSLSEVCEGQIYDKAFEKDRNVSINDYIMMCRKKTSKLLESCTAIGGIIAEASDNEIKSAEIYAENLGLAFQMQDDLLDIMGEEENFGKKTGGDIREGKKTFLLLKAIELAGDDKDRNVLISVINKDDVISEDNFVNLVREIYLKYGVINEANKVVKEYTEKAVSALNNIKTKEGKELLYWFSEIILNRSH